MTRVLWVLCAMLFLSACGGGGSSGSSASSSASTTTTTTTTTTPPALTNFASVIIDSGPAALQENGNNYIAYNAAFVSVTLCAPGTTNCQTIDHVQVDTGSVGLRIISAALNASLLSALPLQTDAAANPVGECYGYVDGYAFGSVRQADFQIGGESVSNMPLHVVGDTGAFATAPKSCSSGGGSAISTVADLGANGIIGIGTTGTDCGAACTVAGGYSGAIYYDCPSSGCASIITRASTTTAPFQQLPNPVAAFSVDNNGSILSLAAPPASGESTLAGTLYFGIGTQTNNALGGQTVLTATPSTDQNGPGLITAIYKGASLNESYIDSGTNSFLFTDSSITACMSKDYVGYYCPATPLSLTPTIQGLNGVTASAAFTLNNAQTLLSTDFAVLPGVGGNPSLFTDINPVPNSFAFGLPFFYGKNVYTAIEGRVAGSATGPYYAY